jgi:hypoxanthine phosphoribosyltransferase
MTPAVGIALVSREAIDRRIAEMGRQISMDYANRSLTVIGILNGSFMFVADLIRQIDPAISLEVDFISVSSYGSGVTPAPSTITRDLDQPVEGKDVLIAEDVLDTGATLRCVHALLAGRGARTIRVAALLEKPGRRRHYDHQVDYVGFQIPDRFVIGYGLDYAQRYRNLQSVHVLDGVSEQ